MSVATPESFRTPTPPAAALSADRHTRDVPPAVQPAVLPGTVVVLGARGRLGYACVQAFAQAGWCVLAHVRPGSALAQFQSDAPLTAGAVRWVDAPLHDPAAWEQLLSTYGQVQVVVNAMATAFSTRAWANEMQQLTQAGIAVAQRSQALLLTPLSILAYGQELQPVLHENTALPSAAAQTPMGAMRIQTELQLRMAAEAGLQVCTLRAGAFYGHAGDGWISGAVAQRLRQGRMAWLGPYDVATPWVYVLDLANTLERIAGHRRELGGWTRLHCAGHQRTGQDWWLALSHVAHQRGWLADPNDLHPGKVRWPLWKPLTWVSPRISALHSMEYVWRTPHRLDNQRLQALIGAEPRTDWLRSVEQTMHLLFPPADIPLASPAAPIATVAEQA